MQMLSIGMPSTLGSYQKLCNIFFGEDSAQAKFINEKIASNPNGADEEVIAEESQMMYLLMHIEEGSKASLESML
jgi:hypothetical protein